MPTRHTGATVHVVVDDGPLPILEPRALDVRAMGPVPTPSPTRLREDIACQNAAILTEGRSVQWWEFSLLGASGGALVEALAVFRWLASWQEARRTRAGRVKGRPPKLRIFLDLPAHAWMLCFRGLLGAGAAALFGASGQITGAYVAVALGFAAPSMLAQLGTIPQVAAAISGTPGEANTGTTPSNRVVGQQVATPHGSPAEEVPSGH